MSIRLGFRLFYCRGRLVAPGRLLGRRNGGKVLRKARGWGTGTSEGLEGFWQWAAFCFARKAVGGGAQGGEAVWYMTPPCAVAPWTPGAVRRYGPVAEQVLLLENISTSIKIGPDQLPSVHKLLVEAARILQMEAPELYVRQHPVPNAYTLAIAGHKPFIVIHTALLELLTPYELQAVLAHELGHLKCDHGLWLTVANVLASGTVSVLPVVTGMVQEALMRWLRAAELTCDRAALLVAQDSKVVISALMKLAGGSPSFASELNVDAFLQQSRSYEEATSSLLGWYLRNAQTAALSHPLPVMRAREIDKMSCRGPCRGPYMAADPHAVASRSISSSHFPRLNVLLYQMGLGTQKGVLEELRRRKWAPPTVYRQTSDDRRSFRGSGSMFCNLACCAFLLFRPEDPRLEAAVYVLCEGPLAAALIAWQCAWLMVSPDHVISVLIHLMPGLAMYCHRYLAFSRQPLLLAGRLARALLGKADTWAIAASGAAEVAGIGFNDSSSNNNNNNNNTQLALRSVIALQGRRLAALAAISQGQIPCPKWATASSPSSPAVVHEAAGGLNEEPVALSVNAVKAAVTHELAGSCFAAAPLAFYLAWQLIYFLLVQVAFRRVILSGGYDTSYRALARRAQRANSPLNSLVRRGSVARRLFMYGLLQFLFTLVTQALAVTTYHSFVAATAWQVVKFVVPLYLGACHQCQRLPVQQLRAAAARLGALEAQKAPPRAAQAARRGKGRQLLEDNQEPEQAFEVAATTGCDCVASLST
ncbi:hypothetical protein VOLCADRAFT_105085 [Volvox carteri f. nagariensis]|uniref:Peptidase M48 domain-containing protein n=1 Tax=Volvox carteri f. nagariensis TaxID=3068 RepID=D8TYB8_VOLCA|nr:uncharacterized protein VOLCADRAFT_105085 [Volvox carteri f. nagariensis]EFJ47524.1 hypothetical protein VOLCADRAFT_105085 [Volvox carteri f. nagariensis]|eukprot:XP_002951348.1 hypothetical protein VOLCADRAFT_105085 [Volvox carteri f. nagariensis]